jgi:hypothetical protein
LAEHSAIAENTATLLPDEERRFESFLLARSLLHWGSVTFKIETMQGEDVTIIKLIGRLRAEYLPELKTRIETSRRRIVLEMNEVTLVDVESVRFLGNDETQGVELRHCPAYIREWIVQERQKV